jgi:hypothetical protein
MIALEGRTWPQRRSCLARQSPDQIGVNVPRNDTCTTQANSRRQSAATFLSRRRYFLEVCGMGDRGMGDVAAMNARETSSYHRWIWQDELWVGES